MRSYTNYMAEAAPRNRILRPQSDVKQVERDLAQKDVPMRKAVASAAKKERERQGVSQPTTSNFRQDYSVIRKAAPLDAQDDGRVGQAVDMIQQAKERERAAHEKEQRKRRKAGKSTTEFDNSPAARMDRAARIAGPMGVLNRQRAQNRELQHAALRGAAADVPEPEKMDLGRDRQGNERGVEIGRVAGHRHLFQPELDKDYEDAPKHSDNIAGYEYHGDGKFLDPETGEHVRYDKETGQYHPWGYTPLGSGRFEDQETGVVMKWNDRLGRYDAEMDVDRVNDIVANLEDDRAGDPKIAGNEKKEEPLHVRLQQIQRGNPDNPKIRQPSGEELEELLHMRELLDAIGEGDNQAVQDIAFTRYAGEEGEMTDSLKHFNDVAGGVSDNVGAGPRLNLGGDNGLDSKPTIKAGNDGKLYVNYGGAGGTEGKRWDAVYGGDLGTDAERFLIDDPNSPGNVYNLNAMRLAGMEQTPGGMIKWTDESIKALFDKALENRDMEMKRTYLKQDGRNAYTPGEGIRSIKDMDLEHIKALAKGGFDHPNNWVWAGQEINRYKLDKDLRDQLDKVLDDKRDKDTGYKGEFYKSLAQRQRDNQSIEGEPDKAEIERMRQRVISQYPEFDMTASDWRGTDHQEKKRILALAQNVMRQDDFEKMFPFIEPGYLSDPEGYEEKRMKREQEAAEETKLIANLASEMTKTNGRRVTEPEVKASQEGQDALDKLAIMRRSPTNREIPTPMTSAEDDDW